MSRSLRVFLTTLCLLIPSIAVLIVPSYNRAEPLLFGMPFFYAYQLLWVPLSALFVGLAYAAYQPIAESRAQK